MSSGARTDPYPNHRFRVEIDDGSAPTTGFSEIRGLAMAVENGGPDTCETPGWVGVFERDATWGVEQPVDPAVTGRRPTESPRLELRRGVTDDASLWGWFRRWIGGTAEPADVRVILLDSTGAHARTWICKRARPVRWRGPRLTGAEPGVATETYELAHNGIEATEPGEE